MTDYRGRGLPAYTVGTISGSSGSTTITGASTAWISTDSNGLPFNQVGAGDTLVLPGGADEISIKAVLSATSLELERALPAAIPSGTAYRIVRRAPNPTGYFNRALQQLEDRMDGVYDDAGNKLVFRTVSSVPTISIKAPVTGAFTNYFSLSSGNVGIGTSTPRDILDLGDGSPALTMGTNSSIMGNLYYDDAWRYRSNDTGGFIKFNPIVAGGGIIFATTAATNSSGPGAVATPDVRMIILPSGNVGIGTASPGARLDVATSGYGAVHVTDVASGRTAYIGCGGNDVYIGIMGSSSLRLQTNSVDRIVLDSAGNTVVFGNLFVTGPVRCGSYTVATVPSASVLGAGTSIYVSDESGGAVMAFSDGTNWRRVTDRAIIS